MMAEYIEKQKIKEQLQLESDCRMIITLQDIFGIIDWFPAADVVEVCRCKDCKHWDIRDGNDPTLNYFCTRDNMWCKPSRKATDFCSYGERRAE